MTKLTVILDCPDHEKLQYTLEIDVTNPPNPFEGNNFFVFNVQEVLHIGNSKVYKGTLADEDGGICPAPIVCKIVEGDTEGRLKDEAEVYAQHCKLQGSLLPEFFFHCSGTTTVSNTPVVCLVTEYVGKCLEGDWDDVSIEDRYRAWYHL